MAAFALLLRHSVLFIQMAPHGVKSSFSGRHLHPAREAGRRLDRERPTRLGNTLASLMHPVLFLKLRAGGTERVIGTNEERSEKDRILQH